MASTHQFKIFIHTIISGHLRSVDCLLSLTSVFVSSSGVVWETQKAAGKRFRAMTGLQCALLERAHQNYETQRLVGANPPARQLIENKMEVRLILLNTDSQTP